MPRKLGIVGDIHGGADFLLAAARRAQTLGCEALIQVGDFGVFAYTKEWFCRVGPELPIPVYFIGGNHEDYRVINQWSRELTEWVPNCFYVPRGTVLELAGYRVGFLGGAGSIDYHFRTRGVDWFPEDEVVSMADATRLVDNAAGEPLDLMITHTPPEAIIAKHFDANGGYARARRMFGAAPDWNDPSATRVELAWRNLGCPPLLCGHMHRRVVDGNVTILDINELAIWSLEPTDGDTDA